MKPLRGRAIFLVFVLVILLAADVLLRSVGKEQLLAKLDSYRQRPADDHAMATTAATQLWTCTMHPQVIKDHPGNCPFCGMPLIPMHHHDSASASVPSSNDVIIDPVVVQNMGVRVAQVTSGSLHKTVRAVGYFIEPEGNHHDINLRMSGWIEHLYANTNGMPVAKGETLFDLYSPDLQVAIGELIAARKTQDAMTQKNDPTIRQSTMALLAAARRRLELLGLETGDIDVMAKLDQPPRTVPIRSPITGHMVDRVVNEGGAVKAGDVVMRVADRSVMWLELQLYETQLPWVQVGSKVHAHIAAAPDLLIEGEVASIYPHLEMENRTASARVIVPNKGHTIREGMYATATIDSDAPSDVLLAPREAVIDTGSRQIVFVVGATPGHFAARQVMMGTQGDDGMVEIRSGLRAGETIVTSGQFLLDSESRLQEGAEKLSAAHLLPMPADSMPATTRAEASK